MKYALLIFSFTLVFSACKKKKEECTLTPGATVAPANEETMITSYLSSNSITTAVELENSGLYYIIDNPGTSERAGLCSAMVVKYVGKLANGTIFDQTSGTATATFTLGGLIEGWKRTLTLVGEGGKMRLYIPPSMGYGANGLIDPRTGNVIIPPNAMLIFDVEVVAVVSN